MNAWSGYCKQMRGRDRDREWSVGGWVWVGVWGCVCLCVCVCCVCVCVSLKVTHASEAKIPRRRGSLQTEVSSCGENVKAHVCTSRTWMHAVDMRCGMVPGSFLAQTFLYPPGETCTMMHAQPLPTCSTPSRGTSGRRSEKNVIDSASL